MVRIILCILAVTILLINLIILILSYLTNVNIYKEYGGLILKIVGIFVLFIIAFYVALGLLGIS